MPKMNKLSNYRTTVMATGNRLSVVYVSTLIVEKVGSMITLDSGGYKTVTTKRKMNQAANQFGLFYSVFQRKGQWFVALAGNTVVPFVDGMQFTIA